MDDILNDILKNKFNSENWILKKYPDFHFFIDQRYQLTNITWREKLYLYANNLLTPPLCYCGNKLKFIYGRYRVYCSVKCMSNNENIINNKKETCLIKYGTASPTESEFIKNKVKKTCIEKYSVSNISKLEITKEKVRKTNNARYGVDYVSQLDSVKDILSKKMSENYEKLTKNRSISIKNDIITKAEQFNLKFIDIISTSIYKLMCNKGHIFNIHKNMLNDRIRNKNTICNVCNPINSSSDSQDQLFHFIRDNYDGVVLKNVRSVIGQELDIYLPELKLAFEYNGVYWHSDVYKDNNYHYNKIEKCLLKDIHLIHIWEDDWIYKRSIIESRILNLLGKSDRVFARNCEVREIDNKDSKNFLESNHIQGNAFSKIRLGLYNKKQLVAVMTFGKLRKCLGQKSIENYYELIRYCSYRNMVIVGGASKLFKYFLKNNNVKQIISYADRCWSNGNLYKRLGFKLESVTKPNYYYVIDGIRKNRFNYRKNILIKMGCDNLKTEHLIMKELGYNRIYDGGNLKFKYENI